MRIISYNVNGIRSAMNKGFVDWLKTDPADIICLQEIKAQKENVDFNKIEELGYQTFWFSAQKKDTAGLPSSPKSSLLRFFTETKLIIVISKAGLFVQILEKLL